MELWPIAGVSGLQLRDQLQEAATRASNASGTAGGPDEVFRAYLAWVDDATLRLRPLLRADDFKHLVQTDRYWATLGTINRMGIWQSLLRELDFLSTRLSEAHKSVTRRLERWDLDVNGERGFVCIVADTNVFIQFPTNFATMDWAAHLQVPIADLTAVRIVIPMLVVDELDGLKKTNERKNARLALKTIYELLGANPRERAIVRAAELNRGGLSVELLFDPPQHNRISVPDDELIDRAAALQSFIGHKVEFVTYDTAAAFRAAAAGIRAHRLVGEDAPEPPEVPASIRGKRH